MRLHNPRLGEGGDQGHTPHLTTDTHTFNDQNGPNHVTIGECDRGHTPHTFNAQNGKVTNHVTIGECVAEVTHPIHSMLKMGKLQIMSQLGSVTEVTHPGCDNHTHTDQGPTHHIQESGVSKSGHATLKAGFQLP